MPVCIGCQTEKPADQYRYRPDLNWLNTRCRPCERTAQKKNYYDRKERDRFGWRLTVLRCNRSKEITAEWIDTKLVEQSHRCAVSGLPINRLDFEVDHIVPRSKGGGDGLSNLQLVCRAANSAKSDLTNDELADLCLAILRTIRPELIGKAIMQAEGINP